MNRKFIAVFVGALVCFFTFLSNSDTGIATEEDGGDIIFKDTKKFPPVLFSHQKHKEAKKKCEDCHPEIFQQKQGSADAENAFNMKAMKKGRFCGSCHNGKVAFKVASSCKKKCHTVIQK